MSLQTLPLSTCEMVTYLNGHEDGWNRLTEIVDEVLENVWGCNVSVLGKERTIEIIYNAVRYLSRRYREELKRSFEMAYGSVMGPCWMEVRKLWLEHITFSTSSIIGKAAHVFIRDEFQPGRGNLSHIHGLVALTKEDVDNWYL